MAEDMPFDLYGELEDAYDAAELAGDAEIVETLDAVGLWSERPKAKTPFMLTLWRAVNGDADAQTVVGYFFFWTDDGRKAKWQDRPLLAIYWSERAAKAGDADAQVNLACLYCPDHEPHSPVKIGRLARHWLEQAAGQKHIGGMDGLALCLKCGKCACCERDIPRAEAVKAEARELEQRN